MATTFPTTVDTFTNPISSDTLNSVTVAHHLQHTDANDAITAIETVVKGIRLDLAASKIVPGATSFALRDHADAIDNLVILDSGTATFRGNIVLSTAAGKLVPGATSFSLRDTSDSVDNFLMTNAGVATFRKAVGFNGTTPTTSLIQGTFAPADLTGKTTAIAFAPAFDETSAGIGLSVITPYTRSTSGGGNSASIFGQGSTVSPNFNGNLTGVQGYSLWLGTTGNSTGAIVGGDFHGANETGATGNVTSVYGVNAMGRHFGTGTTTNLYGVRSQADLETSGGAVDGNVTFAIAYYANIINLATAGTPGVIGTGYGLYVDVPNDSAAITNSYGLRILNQGGTHGNVTTSHGLYINAQSGATGTSFALETLGGQVSFTGSQTMVSAAGSTWDAIVVPASTLTLTGGVNVTTGAGVDLIRIRQPTITSASVTTVTNAATLAISNAPVAGGSVTITNAYAFWIQAGNMFLADASNIVLAGTTGTKIGTNVNQKLGFFNATPITQPPASADVTGFAAGVGTASKSDSTWTGATGSAAYTVGGIVTQLKALGLLAT